MSIPDKAVEAASAALVDATGVGLDPDAYMSEARYALEAALPHLLADRPELLSSRFGKGAEYQARIRELEDAFNEVADLPEGDEYPDTLWGRFWRVHRRLFPNHPRYAGYGP